MKRVVEKCGVVFVWGGEVLGLRMLTQAVCYVCCQLRVVRAFKSTLEDLEEKRSVHSFHSFHSLRSSRSHHGPRTISEEAGANATQQYNHDHFLRTTPPRIISPNYPAPPAFRIKSQSFENVPLVSKQPSPILASANPAHKASPPRTLSHSDIASHRSETSM